MKLTELSIKQALAGLKSGEFTASDLTESAISQIEKVDGELNAFTTKTIESARAEAKAADEKIKNGEMSPLLGIPTAVKDCFCTKDVESQNGSHILEGFKPPYDAESWKRLKAAGSIMVGKANTDEFTMGSSTETSYYGVSKNPWDMTRVSGGSSGGSAAAVAAGECLYATATDTGGSIREPASFCGISGIKVTYGRVPRTGVMSMASSLDSIGALAKSCEDLAIVLENMAGPDGQDMTCPNKEVPKYSEKLTGDIKGMKLGVPKEFFGEGIDPEVEARVREAIAKLEEMGAEIKEVSLPYTKYAIATYYIIAPAEISANMSRYDGIRYGHATKEDAENLVDFYQRSRAEGFGDEVKRRIMVGAYVLSAGYYDDYYKKAQRVRTLIKKDYDDAFAQVDALVCPAVPSVAFKIGENADDPLKMYMADALTVSANIAGICGLSIPCGMAEGMPVGLQILGNQFEESKILNIGDAYQRVTDFHKKYPEL